jgi:hypothetical protein
VIAARVHTEGTQCNTGGACECAAFLETGDRRCGGSMGMWYGRTTSEIGASIAAGIEADRRRAALGIADDVAKDEQPQLLRRRGFLAGLAVAAGGVALGGAAYLAKGIGERQDRIAGDLREPPYIESQTSGGCDPGTGVTEDPPYMIEGAMRMPPEPVVVEEDRPRPPGGLRAPEPPPPPPPQKEPIQYRPRGRMRTRGPKPTPPMDGEH